jgi:hypothetical protein
MRSILECGLLLTLPFLPMPVLGQFFLKIISAFNDFGVYKKSGIKFQPAVKNPNF